MHILYIEDDPTLPDIVSRFIHRTLDTQSWIVHTEDTLTAGIQYLVEHEDVDIVLLDLNLPDSRGISTFHKIQDKVPHLPIVVFTGCNNMGDARRAVLAGALAYIVKTGDNLRSLTEQLQLAKQRHTIRQKLMDDITTD